jgi:hypothetical protein
LGVLLAEDFVNHNPRMTSGREASQAGLARIGSTDIDVHRIIAEGDLVAVHGRYKTPTEGAGMDFFKLKEGKIIEHWDVLQDIPNRPPAARTCSATQARNRSRPARTHVRLLRLAVLPFFAGAEAFVVAPAAVARDGATRGRTH